MARVVVGVALDVDLASFLASEARNNGMKLSRFVEDLIRSELRRRQEQDARADDTKARKEAVDAEQN